MKRGFLSDREWRELFESQGERCCVPGCDERDGPFEAEHSNPSYFVGGKPDQIMCVACHKAKTRTDKATIYHVKRLNGEASSQATRRAERAAKGLRPYFPPRPFSNKSARTRAQIMGEQHG